MSIYQINERVGLVGQEPGSTRLRQGGDSILADYPGKQSGLSDSRVVIGILTLCYAVMCADRTIVSTLGEAIKRDLSLTDTQLGILGGPSFAILYALSTIPIARLSDRHSRAKILSIAVAFWSVATALCASATSFIMLSVLRAAVGVGESGCSPAAQSLISDYVPRERRAFAISMFYVGIPIGFLGGATLAGSVAVHYGWRIAFAVVGAPGTLLALAVLAFVKEPPRGRFDDEGSVGPPPSLADVLRAMWVAPGVKFIVAGLIGSSFVLYSMAQFLHPLFVRAFGLPYAKAALAFGIIVAASSVIGAPLGGALVERLGRRDPRWAAWLPSIGFTVTAPLYVMGVLQSSWPVLCSCLFIGGVTSNLHHGPTFACVYDRIGPQMRATATAVMMLMSTIIGMGLGPLLAGVASDWFAAHAFAGDYATCTAVLAASTKVACARASSTGLRFALASIACLYLFAALMYGVAARRMRSHSVTAPRTGLLAR